jgi:hypothetical protein
MTQSVTGTAPAAPTTNAKLAEGHTQREAIRALKRRLATSSGEVGEGAACRTATVVVGDGRRTDVILGVEAGGPIGVDVERASG